MKKFLGHVFSVILLILAGCAIITPTIVPPLSDELGFNVPNIKGVTTVGIIKGTLVVEQARLRAFDEMATLTLKATDEVKTGIIDIVAMLGLGGTAMLPMAMKRIPPGYKKDLADPKA